MLVPTVTPRLTASVVCRAAMVAGCLALGATTAHAQQLSGAAAQAHARAHAAVAADPTLIASPSTFFVQLAQPVGDAPAAQSWAQAEAAVVQAVNGLVVRRYTIVPGLLLVSSEMPANEAIKIAVNIPGVQYAEPDYVLKLFETPNDTHYTKLWGLHNTGQTIGGSVGKVDGDIDGPEAWDLHKGDPGFVVAMFDSGIQWNHPDLAANVWANTAEVNGVAGVDDDGNGYVDDLRGWDFESNDNDPMDSFGHGTHTSGTVAAVSNNGIGVTGVMWDARLMMCKLNGFSASGIVSDAIEAMQYISFFKVKVSNNSWGVQQFSTPLYNAINASKAYNHLFIAAAGNSAGNNDLQPVYPCTFDLDNIISVAATTNKDLTASFTCYGLKTVDLGAPGQDVYSTTLGGGYGYNSGTSMACPHVVGVVGLIQSRFPSWTYLQVRERLLSTTRPITALAGKSVTGGVVNAAAAVAIACEADCDGSSSLTIDDFICFQTLFALGDPAADCDGSTGLNIDDFICFQTLFALGC